ncbi:MAG: ABC transporter substrate-binding protein [Chloroflexi bacterium]|nr:MAG: ABC transporter substrate-binding protein [Chloroflexota bacterium]
MKRLTIFILVIIALALAACGGAGTATTAPQPGQPQPTQEPPASAEPVVLHVGWLGFPDTLNPAYAFLTESYAMFDFVYSTLMTQNPQGDYVGLLAEERSVSADGLTWTYKLRQGVKWHNGEALTAGQVAWNINAFIQNQDGWVTNAGYIAGFIEAKAVDVNTLEITLEYPISNMDYRVSFLYLVYPPDFEGFTTPEDLQNFTNFSPIGTGPFKIATLDKDQRIIILETNPDYFDGSAKISQIIYQTFDNSDALVQALKVGDIDLTDEVPDSAFAAVQGFENVEAISRESLSITELIINSAPADHDPAPNRNKGLDDPQVRLAIATAINKQDLVDVVLQGNGKPGVTISPPTMGGGFWYNTDIKDIAFNLEEGNRILEEAGYVKGADGVRAKGEVRLEMRLQYPSDQSNYPRAADLMANWLSEIGIKATPEAVDPDSLVVATNPNADYDLVIWGWGADPDPDFILSVLTGDQYVEGGWSDSGYSNPEYDQLYLDQQQVLDRAERQKMVWKMQELVFRDKPYIILYYGNALEAYRSDKFTNFLISPLGIASFQSLMQVEPVK